MDATKNRCSKQVITSSWGNKKIKMYGDARDVERSRHAFDSMYKRNVGSWNILLTANAQNGHLERAFVVFSVMPWRDIVSWNSMIGAFAKSGEKEYRALELFWMMVEEGIHLDRITITAALEACMDRIEVERIHQILARIPELESSLEVRTTLVKVYGRIGCFERAKLVFDHPRRDVVLWTGMILAYARNGHLCPARRVFENMPHHTVVSWNVILTVYAHVNNFYEAKKMLQIMPMASVVSWNILLTAYAQTGHVLDAVRTFCCMDLEGQSPVQVTYLAVLVAISQMGDLKLGKVIHNEIEAGDSSNSPEITTSLIDMYVKCGRLDDARSFFDGTYGISLGISSWNAMIGGYTRSGYTKEAFELFKRMDLEGIQVNRVTILSVLPACHSLREAKLVHAAFSSKRPAMEWMAGIGAELINVYGKHGGVEDAWRIFRKIHPCDLSAWTALIGANAENGYEEVAVRIWRWMDLEGISPDHVAFNSILFACSHGGLVRDAVDFFQRMTDGCDLLPEVDHYVCIVDLFARTGQLEYAEDLLVHMPFEPTFVAWTTYLGYSLFWAG
ncbi:pentatricopeptide repeat-containing protein At2g13600-like [Selaginella moellendorffii]|uniref:pentatricopeptide repeat-containing protein At2g13600-like n=1 Tax=Selaginella moellendorffii TaxID=88036 RepID=UPI000D1CB153|nr:pentatricopeptide repeat-containing protein At2g13600-like [Selaginella moellendorffii]|eukprot:XP_024536489.1 pentatricopeptide repeat-containing protein At2g13600-like [Selaginella moellendorffii]